MAITPTSADLASQPLGEIPASLAADPAHLTPAPYEAVARLVPQKLVELSWIANTTSPPVTPSTVSFYEGFSGSDDLNGRAADAALGGSGATWTASPTGKYVVGSGLLTLNIGAGESPSATVPFTTADGELTAKVVTRPTSAATSVYLDIRRAGSFSYPVKFGNNTFDLGERVSGTTTMLSTIIPPLADGDVVGVRANGSQLQLLDNGAVVQAFTDTSVTSGSTIAIAGFNGSTADPIVLEDLKVTALS